MYVWVAFNSFYRLNGLVQSQLSQTMTEIIERECVARQPKIARMLAVALFTSLIAWPALAEDWPTWRGPSGLNIATHSAKIPLAWSESESVIWKTPLSGRGHSSPIVVEDKLILTTSDDENQVQGVLCFSAKTGKQLWAQPVSRGGLEAKIHGKNTHATPTAASDGKNVFVVFPNHDSIQLSSLTLDGKPRWQKVAGGWKPKKYQFGYAASPLIYETWVIVSGEYEAGGFVAAFAASDGKEIWRIKRPEQISYSSPVIGNVSGKDQLLLSGAKSVTSYDPTNGKLLWTAPAPWEVTCGTLVWNQDTVFASGGFPTPGTVAVKADGSGEVIWQNRVKVYEQSMLIKDGYLYAVADGGIAYCWKAGDGTEMWKERLGGDISASPLLIGDTIIATNEAGTSFLFKAQPEKFELLAKNQLGSEAFATPAFVNGRLYIRTASREGGKRQEMLYCTGK
jgi:outer membrane protein assembly factor BamB